MQFHGHGKNGPRMQRRRPERARATRSGKCLTARVRGPARAPDSSLARSCRDPRCPARLATFPHCFPIAGRLQDAHVEGQVECNCKAPRNGGPRRIVLSSAWPSLLSASRVVMQDKCIKDSVWGALSGDLTSERSLAPAAFFLAHGPIPDGPLATAAGPRSVGPLGLCFGHRRPQRRW